MTAPGSRNRRDQTPTCATAERERLIRERDDALALLGCYKMDKDDLKARIKRLEEALDLVRPHCTSVHHSKKHQHAYDQPCPVVALIKEAKEAKP